MEQCYRSVYNGVDERVALQLGIHFNKTFSEAAEHEYTPIGQFVKVVHILEDVVAKKRDAMPTMLPEEFMPTLLKKMAFCVAAKFSPVPLHLLLASPSSFVTDGPTYEELEQISGFAASKNDEKPSMHSFAVSALFILMATTDDLRRVLVQLDMNTAAVVGTPQLLSYFATVFPQFQFTMVETLKQFNSFDKYTLVPLVSEL